MNNRKFHNIRADIKVASAGLLNYLSNLEVRNHVAEDDIIVWEFYENDSPYVGLRIRVKPGVEDAGLEGYIVGNPIYAQQWWLPVIWDSYEDPDFVKAYCVSIINTKSENESLRRDFSSLCDEVNHIMNEINEGKISYTPQMEKRIIRITELIQDFKGE